MRWQFWLIFLPIAVVVVGLAVVNRAPVPFSIGFGGIWEVPLFLLLLAAALLGILCGGIGAWFAGAGSRRRARQARAEAAQVRDELAAVRLRADAIRSELERPPDMPLSEPEAGAADQPPPAHEPRAALPGRPG